MWAATDDDWRNAKPSPAGRVALVKRGICVFRDKVALAKKYNAKAVLLYNDGASPDRVAPIEISLAQDNVVPALFLSSHCWSSTRQTLLRIHQATLVYD